MSVPTLVQSVLKSLFSRRRRPRRHLPSGMVTECLEARTLLTLLATTATVSNTFQSPAQTGGQEVPVSSPASETVADNAADPEFASFVGLYDIDVDGNSISMVYNRTKSSDPAGVVQAGTFDRYYFEFDGLQLDQYLASASADASQTLVPSVRVTGRSTLVVEVGPGQQIGDGFNAVINVVVGDREANLIGSEVTVSSTFESTVQTGGLEVPLGALQRVVVESRSVPELPQYDGFFDIDLDRESISMTFNLAPGASDPSGTVPNGTAWHYSFQVEGLAPDEFVSRAWADASQTLVPGVTLLANNRIVVDITETMQLGDGFDAVIRIDVNEMSIPLTGKDVTVSNTFQDSLQTGGVEVPNADAATVTIADEASDPELMSYNDLYDIDVDAETIAMVFNLATGATDPSGVVPAGRFDRYYYKFNLGPNEFISSAAIHPDSILIPNIRVTGVDTVVIEIAPGMQIGNGRNAVIDLDVEVAGSLVTGQKWQDLNNDGIRSAGEGWLTGWEMQLLDEGGNVQATTVTHNIDLNNDGLIDPSEMGRYVFEGVQNGDYVVREVVKTGWAQVRPASDFDRLRFDLDQSLGLTASASEFLNWGGLNEKWLFGTAGWYFVMPDGALSQWDGSPRTVLTGTPVAQVGTSAYSDLSLLHSAQPPARNTTQVVVPNTSSNLDFGNYLAPPQLVSVVPGSDNRVSLTWSANADGASTFDVWIADIATRKRFEVTTGVNGQTFQSGILPDRRYRVWVRTEYSPGVYSQWSSAREFEFFRDPIVNPVTAGLDAGIDATPTVTYRAQAGAVSYDVRVISPGSVTPVYLAEKAVGTSHRVATRLALGTHMISVRANFPDGSRNDWSAGQTLTVSGRPIVQVTGNRVTWSSVKAATEYEVWVDRDDAGGNRIQRQIVSVTDIKGNSFTLPGLPRGDYSVWVRAIRAEGGDEYVSYWSNRVQFRVTMSADDGELLPSLDSDLALVVLPQKQSAASESAAPDPQQTPDVRVETPRNAEVAVTEFATAQLAANAPLVNAVMAELTGSDLLDS